MIFADFLDAELTRHGSAARKLRPGECAEPGGRPCPLCRASALAYAEEVPLKERALAAFWRGISDAGTLQPIVPSPRGRLYRGITKRKIFFRNSVWHLGLIAPAEERSRGMLAVEECVIEPESHTAIYRSARELLNLPRHHALAETLQYLIIKGDYARETIILNVGTLSPSIIHAGNGFSKMLTARHSSVAALFFFNEGGGGDRYYLGSGKPGAAPRLRRIYGKPEIALRIGSRMFHYSPVSFSQVNPSILPAMIETAGRLLGLDGTQFLYDLYSGYGLFCLAHAGALRGALGVEISAGSVEAAIANARRQKADHVRFRRSDITPEVVLKNVRENHRPFVVLLDPPRNGAAPGVIESVAAKRPDRVLHIFCNVDLMARDARRWKEAGYELRTAVPFDNFPGTDDLEVMVLFEPSKQERKPPR